MNFDILYIERQKDTIDKVVNFLVKTISADIVKNTTGNERKV